MRLFSKLAAAAMLTAGVAFASSAGAAPSDQTSVLANAQSTVVDMEHDQTFGPSRDLMRRARAVLIIPKLVKAGFIFGGEGGDGVLIAHNKTGWSSPAFYTMGSASFGFQIGLEQAQLVLFIMSDKALRAVERSEFKIGAGAGLTVVTVGASAEGATSGNLSGDIIVWTSAKGAYGGLTLNGSIIKPREGWNNEFYGRTVTVREILAHKVRNPAAAGLLGELRHAS
ncbi:MAG TPA: lipid-binding SYLF domain-containing protein [Rhizomicrobium sp.]|nr:lipid-binding SYLF domain-containing protein [Rhizomicrobium sp.]